jgi:cation transport regulator ChaB
LPRTWGFFVWREAAMPYLNNRALPAEVKGQLPPAGQQIWRTTFNAQQLRGVDDAAAEAAAWAELKQRGWTQDAAGNWQPPVHTGRIAKLDAAEHLVFGWASVAIRKDGEALEDLQGDLIDPEDLEQAAYQFVLHFGETGVAHQGETVGHLVESLVVTKQKLAAMGLDADALPQGWWVGFYVPDEDVWRRIEDGTYRMFSVQGTAQREPVA